MRDRVWLTNCRCLCHVAKNESQRQGIVGFGSAFGGARVGIPRLVAKGVLSTEINRARSAHHNYISQREWTERWDCFVWNAEHEDVASPPVVHQQVDTPWLRTSSEVLLPSEQRWWRRSVREVTGCITSLDGRSASARDDGERTRCRAQRTASDARVERESSAAITRRRATSLGGWTSAPGDRAFFCVTPPSLHSSSLLGVISVPLSVHQPRSSVITTRRAASQCRGRCCWTYTTTSVQYTRQRRRRRFSQECRRLL